MATYQDIAHPILILVRGLPGSGKTYLALELQKAIGEKNVVMLDPDTADYESPEYYALSKQLSQEGLDVKIHPYRFLRGQAYAGITARKVIIWNQPFTNLGMFTRMIENLQAYAKAAGQQLPVLIVEVEIDYAAAKRRVETRKAAGGHGPSDTLFERYVNDYTTAATEGFDVVTVYGEDEVSRSVATVMEAIEALL